MNFLNLSLKRLIVVPIILLVLVSIFLTGFFFIQNNKQNSESLSLSLQSEITSRIKMRTSEFLNSPNLICSMTSYLISDGFLDASNPEKLEKYFIQLLKNYPQVSSIYFGNASGGLADAGRDNTGDYFVIRTENYLPGTFQKYRINSQGNITELLVEIPDFDARTRPWFLFAKESSPLTVRSDPFVLFTDDDISISTSQAVFDPAGNFVGVVSCDVFLRHISNFLTSVDVGETGLSFITDHHGRVLASSIDADNSENYGLLPPCEYNNSVIRDVGMQINSLYGGLPRITSIEEFEIDNEHTNSFVQILPFEDLTGKSYYIITVIPIEDFAGFFDENKNDIIILLFVSLLIALTIGVLVAKLIAKPIHALRISVDTMQISGAEKFPSHWMKEVNELSTVFSRLIIKLNNTMKDLKKSEETMSLALKGTQAATWNWNISTGEIVVNKRWAEMLGYTSAEIEPLTESKWNSFICKKDIKRVYALIDDHFTGVTDFYEASLRLRHKNKSWIWILDRGMVLEWSENGKPLRMSGTHVDITLRKNAEEEKERLTEQITKTRNLDSIGHLAGGVAHDLNNLLTPIIGYSELIQADTCSELHTGYIKEIFRAAISAKQLVNQLLAFGRKQHLELSFIELNLAVNDFSQLLRRTIRENIKISYQYSEKELYIKGDITQLEQVLMNLAVNAQDAMPNGGELVIKTSSLAQTEDTENKEQSVSFALLEISDNGSGMTEETTSKIFEPFYSLKEGKGTGLGLSTVYGIVKQHNGSIDVNSAIGIGSTFRIKLPLQENDASKVITLSISEQKKGNETILLVEDSDDVMTIVVMLLKNLGYIVYSASCGSEALEILKKHGHSIDLMLSDMIMPGISLEELYKGAIKIAPKLKVMFMSGYSGDSLDTNWLQDKAIPFISKPFAIEDLADKVRESFDGR